jgi:hypothetical protein
LFLGNPIAISLSILIRIFNRRGGVMAAHSSK